MRNFALAFAPLFALCALAYAGSDPLPSGKEMQPVALEPAACPNWTGFYVGALGGYKYALIHPSMHVTEDEGADARAIEALLQQRARSHEPQKLLGALARGRRPEARASASGHDGDDDIGAHQNQCFRLKYASMPTAALSMKPSTRG